MSKALDRNKSRRRRYKAWIEKGQHQVAALEAEARALRVWVRELKARLKEMKNE